MLVLQAHKHNPDWAERLVHDARPLLPLLTGLSVLILVLHIILASAIVQSLLFRARRALRRARKPTDTDSTATSSSLTDAPEPPPIAPDSFGRELHDYIAVRGGMAVWLWNAFRLALCLAVVALTIAEVVIDEEHGEGQMPSFDVAGKWGKKNNKQGRKKHKHSKDEVLGWFTRKEWLEIGVLLHYTYLSLLSFLTLTLSRLRNRKIITRHLLVLSLAAGAVFAYRDVYPLALVHSKVRDSDTLGWTRTVLVLIQSVLVPLLIPRIYVPIDPSNAVPHPEQIASFLSYFTYEYMTPLVLHAWRVPSLSFNGLPPLADYDRAVYLAGRYLARLDPHRTEKAKKRYLAWGLLDCFKREYVWLATLTIVNALARFAAPIGIKNLLAYLETGGKGQTIRRWVWILWIFIGPFIGSLTFQAYIFIATRVLVRTEAILTQLLFEHALRIRFVEDEPAPSAAPMRAPSPTEADGNGDAQQQESGTEDNKGQKDESKPKGTNLVGKLNNLISSDLQNIVEGRDFLFLILYGPVLLIVSTVILYRMLGWAALVGIGVMVASLPLPGLMASLINQVQIVLMESTDARIQAVTETMNALRVSKLFGWIAKDAARIAKKREVELKHLRRRNIYSVVNMNVNFLIPLITMIITFMVFTKVMHQDLTASRIFSSITIFEIMRNQLHVMFWEVRAALQAKVSLDRLDTFLKKTELIDSYDEPAEPSSATVTQAQRPPPDFVGFHNATFAWHKTKVTADDSSSAAGESPTRNFRLHLDVEFKRCAINLIVGPTGAGKSSMLLALLGEMHFEATPDSYFQLPRKGGVAYAAQEAWLMNETLRENIVFGSDFNEARYNKVIHQCALERDLTLFDAGDKTEVGEKGLTLSGGQKARISLARALYSSAEFVILDDILSALDVHTSRWIVNKAFSGDIVRGRTVLLVTHHINLCAPIADNVIALDASGAVVSQGSLGAVLSANSELVEEAAEEAEQIEIAEKVIETEGPPDETKKAADGKLILAEEKAMGRVDRKALVMFFKAAGGPAFWILFFGGMALTEVNSIFQTWWLGAWAKAYDQTGPVPVNYYLAVYGALLLASIAVYSGTLTVYVDGSIRASRKLHAQLAASVLGSTLRWLDTTPVGRIISRFSQDIRAVDTTIYWMFSDLVEIGIALIFKLGAVLVFNPIFLLPGALVIVFGAIVGELYIHCQLSVKREVSNAKSPLYSSFNSSMDGLVSIRAYGADDRFKLKTLNYLDRYLRASTVLYNLNRWVTVRIDTVSAGFSVLVALYCTYFSTNSDASSTGFSLNLAVTFSGMVLWFVRVLNEFEVSANSLERLADYIKSPQEPSPTDAGKPPAYWPSTGSLEIEGLTARYSNESPLALKGISLKIENGQKVGIVGRTGSGKSTLALALLRAIPTEGKVVYDGFDTCNLNLDDLRQNIALIPQDPVLYSGSLRTNLDPWSEHDDATLQSALRASGLLRLQGAETGAATPSEITLDTTITPGGANLSQGQRQLVSLARALVRNTKVLILDEATASVDLATDSAIQASIRRELSGTTLLVIAHRLRTIMDYDRIVVLDAGTLQEFGSPRELLSKKHGVFAGMVAGSGEEDELRAIAEGRAGVLPPSGWQTPS